MIIQTTVQVGLYIIPMSQMMASHYDEPTQRKTYSSEQYPTEQAMRQQIDADLAELLAKHEAERPNDLIKASSIVLDVAPTPKRFYPTGGVNWIAKAFQYKEWRNGSHEGWELDEPVKWTNDYGVCWETNIFGFDKDGEAVLYSDCYWMTKAVGRLTRLEPTEGNSASVTLADGGRLHEKWAVTEFLDSGTQIDLIDSPRREDVERYMKESIDLADFSPASTICITLNGQPVEKTEAA